MGEPGLIILGGVMSDRDEFERVFKSVFKGHRMTRGSNGDYIGIVPWSAWKIWQAQRPAPVVLHEDMTEDFKEQWQNGLPLDSAEARWAFCGWKAARAQQAGSGEAVAYRVTECPGLTYLVDTIEDAEHGKAFYGYGYEALYTHPSASRPNLSTIAQKKLDQMGATVHGVLVKNEAGAWAAVSDAGRVMWLDGFELQAARAQEGGSGEAVDWDSPAVDPIVTKLHHRFKEWSQRGFTADDVTWCEVRKDVADMLNAATHPSASVLEGWRIQKGESVGRGDVDVVLRRNNGSAAFFRSDNDSKDALIVEFLTAMLASTTPQPADSHREATLVALLGVMCGWFETLAGMAGWTPENASSAWAGYRAAKQAMCNTGQNCEHCEPEHGCKRPNPPAEGAEL